MLGSNEVANECRSDIVIIEWPTYRLTFLLGSNYGMVGLPSAISDGIDAYKGKYKTFFQEPYYTTGSAKNVKLT